MHTERHPMFVSAQQRSLSAWEAESTHVGVKQECVSEQAISRVQQS